MVHSLSRTGARDKICLALPVLLLPVARPLNYAAVRCACAIPATLFLCILNWQSYLPWLAWLAATSLAPT